MDADTGNILVIDDNAANRYAITRHLRQAGYAVCEAGTGPQGLQVLAEEKPDLVILDVHLPGLSGFEVCRTIKGNPQTSAIPVIHVSATCTRSEDRVEGLEGGADGYLIEPIERAELLAHVKAMLRARQAERGRQHALELLEQKLRELECAHGELARQHQQMQAGQAELERERRRYRHLFELAPDGYLVTDLDSQIQEANQRACQMLQQGRDWLLGKPLVEFFAPAGKRKLSAILRQLRDGSPPGIARLEGLLGLPHGTPMPCVVTVNAILEAQGAVTGLRWVLQDITPLKGVEAALRGNEGRLRLALDAGRMGTWDWEVGTQRVEWSEGHFRLLGCQPGEIEASNEALRARIHPEDLARQQHAQQAALEQRVDYACEFRVVWPNGSVHWVEGRGRFLCDEHGAATRMYGVLVDIDQEKRNALALEEAKEQLSGLNLRLEQMVEQRTLKLGEIIGELEHFSYCITHDLRAPLRAMQSFGQILAEECGPALDAQHRDYLLRIVGAAARMDHLITDALRYNQVIRQELELAPVDTDGLLRGIINSYPELQKPRADIRIEGRLPVVLAHEASLTQCLSQLLNNAVKFVPPATLPQVRIRAERREPFVRLWFADNGIGVPPECQGRIFGMFERLVPDYPGTGIGLALVRKMVQHMGGRVGVEPGRAQGSRFWLELKAAGGTLAA